MTRRRATPALVLAAAVAATAAALVPAGPAAAADVLLSRGRPATASSSGASTPAGNAVDGSRLSRWASAPRSDPQWLQVDLGATSRVARVRLDWASACATGYRIETSADAAAWTALYTTTTGDGGVDEVEVVGTGRYVRVTGTARCRALSGYALRELEVYGTGDVTAPTVPQRLRAASVAPTAVTLAWDAATDDVGVAAYDVYTDGNKVTDVPGGSTTATLTGLTPATAYRFTVFARDAAGNTSASSASLPVTTPPAGDTRPPTAPTGVTVTGTTSSTAGLRWTASTDDVGVTGYDVLSGTAVVATATGTSVTVTGLASDTTYTLTVRARDAGGNTSAPSAPVTARTGPPSGGGGVPAGIATVSTGWTVPWGMDWLPDGRAVVTERESFAVHAVTAAGVRTRLGTVPNAVGTGGEGGLLGVAVSPSFATDGRLYFFHTAAEGNRIVRMTLSGGTLGGYTVLVDGIAKNRFHNGGRLAFGPDGYLYATTGDAQQGALAQDRTSLNGKVLRMRADGTPAPGNPFGTLVYSYGHRNPQGLAWDSAGRLWEAEFGNTRYDELNLVRPGLNYGWPTCEGSCTTSGLTNPARQWTTSEASPSAIAIVGDVVYMAALRGQRLWRIPVPGGVAGTPQAYYVTEYGRLRTVVKVPGADALWLSTTNSDQMGRQPAGSDRIFRVDIR